MFWVHLVFEAGDSVQMAMVRAMMQGVFGTTAQPAYTPLKVSLSVQMPFVVDYVVEPMSMLHPRK